MSSTSLRRGLSYLFRVWLHWLRPPLHEKNSCGYNRVAPRHQQFEHHVASAWPRVRQPAARLQGEQASPNLGQPVQYPVMWLAEGHALRLPSSPLLKTGSGGRLSPLELFMSTYHRVAEKMGTYFKIKMRTNPPPS